jgi:hypothetical protein
VGTVDESVFECASRKEALANDALSGANDSESAPDKKEETREILRAMMQASISSHFESLLCLVPFQRSVCACCLNVMPFISFCRRLFDRTSAKQLRCSCWRADDDFVITHAYKYT